jgi:hypothetical protein
MDTTAWTMGHDALWSLTVIAVVVGPPALLVAIVVWVTRRIARLRTTRTGPAVPAVGVARVAAPPSAGAAGS